MQTRVSQLPPSAELVIRIALGVEYSGRLVSQINHWLTNSGPEWTVSRLKSLRAAAMQLRASNHEEVRDIYRENSIAYYHGTLVPRGPFGVLVSRFLRARQPQVIRRLDAVMRCYTAIRLSDMSDSQLRKAKASITGGFTGDPRIRTCLEGYFKKWGEQIKPDFPKLGDPSIHHMKMFTSTYHRCKNISELSNIPYGKLAASLSTAVAWPERVSLARSEILAEEGIPDYVSTFRDRVSQAGADAIHTGRIHVIQEAGCKARVVAIPTAYHQWFFEPLHRALDIYIQGLPQSCVHDQNAGAYWLRDRLTQGHQTWCFDLSSATDRFPRSLQTSLLVGLGLDEFADDLDEACFSWLGPDGEDWDYSVGQPMGLYSSFPLFHLSHYGLLLLCCKIHSVDESCFVVLGDDVCISDTEVAKMYYQILLGLGVKISTSKSISSANISEFAGFVGIKTNRSANLYRPYKYGKRVRGVHAPINLLHSLGRSVRKLGPAWEKFFKDYSLTRAWRWPDLTPIIPSVDSGGVSPPVVDTTRLENLLYGATAGTLRPAHFELDSIEDIDNWRYANVLVPMEVEGTASQLLGKQLVGEQSPERELLSTPEPLDEQFQTVARAIAQDPLMDPVPSYVLHKKDPVDELDATAEHKGLSSNLRTMNLFDS